MCELQLIAPFVRQTDSVFEPVSKDIHELDFVAESHNDVEPGRMESHRSRGLRVLVLLTDFQLLCSVVPNFDVPGTCSHDKFLSEANVHSCNSG